MSEPQSHSRTIQDLKPGESITAFFILRKRELKTKKDGSPYLSIELGDRTGRIGATIWENAEGHYQSLDVGSILKVQARVMTYRDALQLNIERFRKAETSDGIRPRDFVKRGPVDVDQHAVILAAPLLHHLLQKLCIELPGVSRDAHHVVAAGHEMQMSLRSGPNQIAR